MDNIKTVPLHFTGGCPDKIPVVTQWDRGQILVITGIALPPAFECHFGTSSSEELLMVAGITEDGVSRVQIPNELLCQPENIFAYLYRTDGDSGKTVYRIDLTVDRRSRPEETPTDPDDPHYIDGLSELISAVSDASESAFSSAAAAEQSADSAAGYVIADAEIDENNRLNLTYENGTTVTVDKSLKGDPGEDAVTDQTYSPSSTHAQSGTAVAQAVAGMSDIDFEQAIEFRKNANYNNLLTKQNVSLSASGQEVGATGYVSSDFIPVENGTTLYWLLRVPNTAKARVVFYNENKEVKTVISAGGTEYQYSSYTFTQKGYVRVCDNSFDTSGNRFVFFDNWLTNDEYREVTECLDDKGFSVLPCVCRRGSTTSRTYLIGTLNCVYSEYFQFDKPTVISCTSEYDFLVSYESGSGSSTRYETGDVTIDANRNVRLQIRKRGGTYSGVANVKEFLKGVYVVKSITKQVTDDIYAIDFDQAVSFRQNANRDNILTVKNTALNTATGEAEANSYSATSPFIPVENGVTLHYLLFEHTGSTVAAVCLYDTNKHFLSTLSLPSTAISAGFLFQGEYTFSQKGYIRICDGSSTISWAGNSPNSRYLYFDGYLSNSEYKEVTDYLSTIGASIIPGDCFRQGIAQSSVAFYNDLCGVSIENATGLSYPATITTSGQYKFKVYSFSGEMLHDYTTVYHIDANQPFKLHIYKYSNATTIAGGIANIKEFLKNVYLIPDNSLVPFYYFNPYGGSTANNYMLDKIAEINTLDADCGYNGDMFVFITDIHYEMNRKKSPRLIKYIVDHTSVSRAVFGGDMITNEPTKDAAKEDYIFARNQFDFLKNDKWLAVVGNHEWNSYGSGSAGKVLTKNELYRLVESESDASYKKVYHPLLYVFENKAANIAYLMVGCNANGEILTDSAFATAIQNALSDIASSGMDCVVISHVALNKNSQSVWYVNTSFNSVVVSKIQSAIRNNALKFICVLSGDNHNDHDYTVPESSSGAGDSVLIISTMSDGIDRPSTYPATEMTVNEQSFDVVGIDKTNRAINLIKVGAGSNRTFHY